MRHYVQHEQSQDEVIKALQRQVDELTSANLMLQDQLARNGPPNEAMGNLRDTDIKYSNEETTISVRAYQTPGKAHISVYNQGTSPPQAVLDQLFRAYGRLRGTGRQKGSGLGLYIARSIVEAHGGEILLQRSTEENQGTTFSLDLPL